MLVLDSFKGHLPLAKNIIREVNTVLWSQQKEGIHSCRWLDMLANKPFEDHLKSVYSKWLYRGDHVKILTEKIMEPGTTMDLDRMVPNKSRTCSSKSWETPYFVFHGWNQRRFVWVQVESREDTENDEGMVYEQERDGDANEEGWDM